MTDPHRPGCDCPGCELIAQRIAEELVVAAAEQVVRARWARRLAETEQHFHRREQGAPS